MVRRRRKEKQASEKVAPATKDKTEIRGLRDVLDEALAALPLRYRTPLILFHLEGHSLEETAEVLRCKPGTLHSWLSRGRELLRHKLLRKDVALPAGGLASLLSSLSTAPLEKTSVLDLTDAACFFATEAGKVGGVVSDSAVMLLQGALRTMWIKNVKVACGVLACCGALSGAIWALPSAHSEEANTPLEPEHTIKSKKEPTPDLDPTQDKVKLAKKLLQKASLLAKLPNPKVRKLVANLRVVAKQALGEQQVKATYLSALEELKMVLEQEEKAFDLIAATEALGLAEDISAIPILKRCFEEFYQKNNPLNPHDLSVRKHIVRFMSGLLPNLDVTGQNKKVAAQLIEFLLRVTDISTKEQDVIHKGSFNKDIIDEAVAGLAQARRFQGYRPRIAHRLLELLRYRKGGHSRFLVPDSSRAPILKALQQITKLPFGDGAVELKKWSRWLNEMPEFRKTSERK